MKKKKIALGILAIAAAVMLAACTQSDKGNGGNQSSPGSAGGLDGQGSVASGTAENTSGSDSVSAPADNTPGGNGDAAVSQNGTGEASQEAAPATEEALAEDNYTDAEMETLSALDAEEAAASWSGTYISDAEETLTLGVAENNSISFSFTNSGISGTAELNGSQAIYKGDDHHVVVFEYAEGAVQVTVLSEEDYDTSSSPLNGLYVSQ